MIRNYYDGFGRLTKTTTPDNISEMTSYNWVLPGSIPGDDLLSVGQFALYEISVTKSGRPSNRTFFDQLKRPIEKESDGFANKIYKQMKYDVRGNVEQETGNYETGATNLIQVTNYFSDATIPNELIRSETTDGLITNTTRYVRTYLNGSTTTETTDPAHQKDAETIDATGKLKLHTHNGGNNIEYEYNSSGLLTNVKVDGINSTTITYDTYGNQSSLTERNFGTNIYVYNSFHELTSQTDANGNVTTVQYDPLGRRSQMQVSKGSAIYNYTYSYFSTGNGIGKLSKHEVTGPNGVYSCNYEYDALSQLKFYTENSRGQINVKSYKYDLNGNLIEIAYPNGFSIIQDYTSNGFLYKIKNKSSNEKIWEGTSMTSLGRYSNYSLGPNNIQSQIDYDAFGFPSRYYTPNIQNLFLDFNHSNGNLNSRWDKLGSRNLKEEFDFDNSNQLTKSEVISPNYTYTNNMSYDTHGRITNKDDSGTNSEYWLNHFDAVKKIDAPSPNISHVSQNISYTPFNKLMNIDEGDYSLNINYGPDNERRESELLYQGAAFSSTLYFEDYEKLVKGSQTQEIYYINSPIGLCAMYVVENGTGTMYYVYKDHLGSILKVTNFNGHTYEQSFDAWGRFRNPDDWTYNVTNQLPSWLFRGFTGHEHLTHFSLINMNGRLYDPVLGTMLSPDNFVKETNNSINYNRYAYCLNNPLSYIDKDGNIFWPIIVVAAVITGYLQASKHLDEPPLGILVNFSVGAAFGAGSALLTWGLASASATIAVGSTAETISLGSAFASAAIATGVGTISSSIYNNARYHERFVPFDIWVEEMLVAGATAAITQKLVDIFQKSNVESNWHQNALARFTESSGAAYSSSFGGNAEVQGDHLFSWNNLQILSADKTRWFPVNLNTPMQYSDGTTYHAWTWDFPARQVSTPEYNAFMQPGRSLVQPNPNLLAQSQNWQLALFRYNPFRGSTEWNFVVSFSVYDEFRYVPLPLNWWR